MGKVGLLFLLLLLFPGVNLRSRDYYGNLPLFVRGVGFWVWCEGKHFSCMRFSICSRMYVFILHIFWEVRPSLGLTWQPSISKHNLCSSSVYVSKLSRTREEFNTWFGSDATAVLKVTSPTTKRLLLTLLKSCLTRRRLLTLNIFSTYTKPVANAIDTPLYHLDDLRWRSWSPI